MGTATQSDTSARFDTFDFKVRTRKLYRNGSRLKIRGHPVQDARLIPGFPSRTIEPIVTAEPTKTFLSRFNVADTTYSNCMGTCGAVNSSGPPETPTRATVNPPSSFSRNLDVNQPRTSVPKDQDR